jgi:hypothetical protein
MPNMSYAAAGVAAIALLAAAPASAHHSGAMFDSTKEVTIEGTVKAWQFTSPHSWLQVLVTGPDGKVVQWAFEGGGPSGGGLKKDTFKPGEKVTVKTHPMKDGRPAGSLGLVTFADGRTFGRGAPPAPAPAGPPPP